MSGERTGYVRIAKQTVLLALELCDLRGHRTLITIIDIIQNLVQLAALF